MADPADRLAPHAQKPAPPPRRRRRWLRWVGALALVFVVLLAGLAGAAWWVLRTENGRAWLTATALDAINGSGAVTVRLGALEGDLPFSLVLRDLTVTDRDGPWLSADRLALAWEPWALLGGRLHVRAISATALSVERPPNLPPSDTPEEPEDDAGMGFDPRTLGLLRVDRIAFEGVHLGEALVGQPVLLDVTGQLAPEGTADAPDAITARLDARRIDGHPGDARIGVTLKGPDLDHLAVDIRAAEDQGGMVTTLAGLPGAAAWTIGLQGDGPMANWRGTLSADAEGLADLSGALALNVADLDAPSVTLSATAQPQEGAPPAWQAALTEQLDLALSAALDDDGRITLSDLRLANGALEVTGSATADPAADTVSARLETALTHPDRLAPLVALPLDRGTAIVTAEGRLTAPTVTAQLQTEGLSAGVGADALALDTTVTPDGPLDDDGTTLAFDLRAHAEGLSGPQVVADLFPHPLDLTGAGTVALADRRVTVQTLRLSDDQGVALDVTAEAKLAPSLDGTAEANLTLSRLDRLGPVLGGLSPRGSGLVTLSDVTLNADAVVAGDVRLALENASLGLPQADAALGPAPTLTARVTFDPAAGLTVRDLALDGGAATLAGEATIPADFAALEAVFTADLTDLGMVVGDALRGPLTLDAQLSGPLADPNLTATARMVTATLGGQAWDDIALEATAEGLARGPSGALSLTGSGPGGVVDLTMDYALPQYARLSFTELSGRIPGTRLTGQVSADLATLLADGALRLAVEEPGRLADWGAPPLAGSLTADVVLTPSPEGRQSVTVTAAAPTLRLPDGDVTLGALDVRAALTDALGTPALDATVTSSGGGAAGLTWERLTATARGPLADLAVTADLTGDGPTGALTLATAARVQPPGLAETAQVRLERLDLETQGHAITLRQPGTLSLVDGARVDRLVLGLDDGTLTVSGGQGGNGLDVSVTAEGLPLALTDLAAPDLGLGGRLDLSATLSGRLPTPRGTLTLTGRDVTLDGTTDSPPLTAEVTGRLEGGRLTADATLRGLADTPGRITADVPVRLGGGTVIPDSQPLSLSAQWNGPIGAVWEMIPMVVEHRLSGALALDATVSGTLAAPAVNATVQLSDGRYEHLSAGTLIDTLSLDARAQGTDHLAVTLSGTDGGNGRLEGDGDIQLTPDGPVGGVHARLDDMIVVRRDDVTASADATIDVRLEGDRGAVTGDIRTREVRVDLNAIAGGGSVTTLDVVEIDDANLDDLSALDAGSPRPDGGGVSGDDAPDEDTAFPIALDLTVDMPNRVYVTGQGLDSEWAGSLKIGGTAAIPRVTGTIGIRRGSFEAVGKQLNIETGTVQFAGGRQINPLLDVVAVYQAEEIEARVGLTGPANDPEIVLDSVPPRPRDEVLSQILFGKSSGELTTLETVQLARALASLTGVTGGGGPDVLGMVRGAVGLDVLRLGGDVAAGGAGLEAGRYVSDDIYVGVEQGLEPGSGGVTVEVDLGAGFKVESKAGRAGDGEVGVLWRKDY
ncbi:hypothetical protein F1188_08295 [Roseospira marina]|uniref:Translocation and assembly module TamB C-terminal domain-containing protein n=1 Tax=Roseospira marina TaxID=140057 RepID=A0A5M6IDH5_9PROT|nr:translocation/assembly module TamB domain-containing protein [Roseospira marina]KAA5606007.1 hypothetical protein F1188_08295 [Roseospira marina]MBB4313139.1 translocation and assembly module TamB [Roseospira marina]MBB5086120.1 translocation and assembly module TamB [Roseospira marina]